MKQLLNISLVVILSLATSSAQAQMNPVRSNYLLTSFMDHPGAAGNKQCLDLRLGHRNQWVGFPDAPTNSFLSLSGRLGESVRATQGIGVRVETDQAGAWGTTSASLAYSHKIKLSQGGWLSGGFSLGVSQYSLNLDNLDITATDPALGDQTTQFIFPLVDAGFWYQDKRSFGGISLLNVTAGKLSAIAPESTTARNLVITGGTSLELDGRYTFRPSTNIRYSPGLPASFELSGAMVYDDLASVGLGYRNQSALIASFQLALFNYMRIGYSYDFNISKINVVSRSSHEVVLTFSACDMKATKVHQCPAYD